MTNDDDTYNGDDSNIDDFDNGDNKYSNDNDNSDNKDNDYNIFTFTFYIILSSSSLCIPALKFFFLMYEY